MKKISLLIISALAILATACHDPEYVKPTADRQGFTSLTAIFTSGAFVDQQMAKLTIGDEMPERLVIPVPWFFPETSDDETTPYMTKVRLQAELQENCFISPALTIVDLTNENWYTYTDAQGNSKKICITGERVKSDKCELLAFSLIDPALAGVIDKANKKISIISGDNLDGCLAEAQISAHATISPDPATTPLNYNEPVELTVTAHNGVTKAVYTVIKDSPAKIDRGFNSESLELLFNFDPVATLGMPPYTADAAPSLAAIGNNLVVALGDGTTPVYLNRITGQKLGEINVGPLSVCSVTNDEAENLLLVNHALANEECTIYRTKSVSEAPTLFYSFTNDATLPMGNKMKVFGNIDADALIIITNEGVAGLTSSSRFTAITVRGGAVTDRQVVDITGSGMAWGAAPVNTATVVAASTELSDGIFASKYDPSNFVWVKGDGSVGFSINSDTTGWGLNPNCLDSKCFNNINYVALFVVSHFPHWGMGPQLYLYDTSDMSKFTGDVASAPALVLANGSVDWYQQADAGVASGDVVIAPSADGFKLYIYYYDHNSGVIGGYTADCIAK